MSTPSIPNALLGVSRRLTANEIGMYKIDCGPGGSLHGTKPYYESGNPELHAYVFDLPSCVMDADGLYTLTIYLKSQTTTEDPVLVK